MKHPKTKNDKNNLILEKNMRNSLYHENNQDFKTLNDKLNSLTKKQNKIK